MRKESLAEFAAQTPRIIQIIFRQYF